MTTRTIRGAALAVAAAAAFCPLSARCADLDPPMPPCEPHVDAKKLVSIDLPKGSKPRPDFAAPDDASVVAAWELDLDPSTPERDGFVYVFQRQGAANAVLVGSMGRGCPWGALEDDSIEAKNGEWRDRRLDTSKDQIYRERIVAAKGQVFCALVQMSPAAYDRYRLHVDAIIDTFKVLDAPKPAELPAAFKLSSAAGRDVWTDGKKNEVDRIVREWNNSLDLAAKVFAGKGAFVNPPRLIVCANDADYEAIWGKSATGAAPRSAYYSGSRRAVVVRLSQHKDENIYQSIQRAAGEQMCEYWFGGYGPVWIEQGLRMYLSEGVLCNGHFDQPRADTIEKARESVNARKKGLGDVMAMTEMPREGRDNLDRELLAWHWYFRHGPGAKTLGDRYRKCLDVLRQTGDVREATKAWDGVDMTKLRDDFIAWIGRWREGKSD